MSIISYTKMSKVTELPTANGASRMKLEEKENTGQRKLLFFWEHFTIVVKSRRRSTGKQPTSG